MVILGAGLCTANSVWKQYLNEGNKELHIKGVVNVLPELVANGASALRGDSHTAEPHRGALYKETPPEAEGNHAN
jgi:hypothetical protein